MSQAPGAAERGFSLIEVLVASALFLVVLLGVIPLFTRSMVNNVQGRDSSTMAAFSRERAEQLLQFPFNNPDVTVPAGSADDSLVTQEDWDDATKRFTTDDIDEPRWLRRTEVQDFNYRDLLDNGRLDDPLLPGTNPRSIHLKEIVIDIGSARSQRGGDTAPFVRARPYSVRVLKSF
jgi:prepilin-type N-terminal cleavage/methylation domain-containing protein